VATLNITTEETVLLNFLWSTS